MLVAWNRLALPAHGLTINPRSSWAIDRAPKGPLDSEDVRFLLVHHSASRNGHTGNEAPGILRSFYDFHTGPEKGWNDIAYNFLIDADGGIWEGRTGSLAGPVAGDATGGNQGFSQLVCVIGDYNSAQPTAASVSSLVLLLAWLADRYGVSTLPGAEVSFTSRGSNRWPLGTTVVTPTINGHRAMSLTTCPGDNLHSYVIGGLTADVDAVRGGSTPSTQPPTTTTTQPTTTTEPTPTTTSRGTTTSTGSSTTSVGARVPDGARVATSPMTSSATAIHSTSSSAPPMSTTTTPAPPLTSLLAEKAGEPFAGSLPGVLTTVGLLLTGAAGAVLWRMRRMR